MKTPISYYGGKQRLASKIIPLIPKHTVYVEPFAGGAAIFFAKPWPKVTNSHHYREVLNDKDSNLINFYTQLRNNGPELCEKLSLTLCSEAEHRISKDLTCDDLVERARRYFVNINQGYSNKLNSGWSRGVFGRNFGYSWTTKIKNLYGVLERLSSVFITCDDALKIIKQWDSPQTFFYCDPPYIGADQGHYSGYSLNDFQNLVDTLDKCSGSFLLSHYESPAKFPESWERFRFDAVVTARGRSGYDRSQKKDESDQNRKRTEIVYRRLNTVPVRDEIQKLYDSGAFDCFASKR